ncbi:hypothetical protein SAURM35S_03960 [Streptomyces aurantiogriseus]
MGDFTKMTEADWAERADEFRMLPGETLAGVLKEYAEVARRTDELVATLPDLDAAHPLPAAPWFEPGAWWSACRVLLHIVAETAQHAGHADIIRESLDGAKSWGDGVSSHEAEDADAPLPDVQGDEQTGSVGSSPSRSYIRTVAVRVSRPRAGERRGALTEPTPTARPTGGSPARGPCRRPGQVGATRFAVARYVSSVRPASSRSWRRW